MERAQAVEAGRRKRATARQGTACNCRIGKSHRQGITREKANDILTLPIFPTEIQ